MLLTFELLLGLLRDSLCSLFGILCLLWAIALQFLLSRNTGERWMHWLLPVIFGGGVLAFVALILLFDSFFALLAVALLPYLVIVLMGTLVGTALSRLYRLRETTRNESEDPV